MTALSIRIEPALEKMLDIEVSRRKTTRSKYVQDLLAQALAPKDPMALLMKVRAQYEVAEPDASRSLTHKSANVKVLVKEAIEKKHAKARPVQRKKALAA
jgi:metal-responsive CopG/Arc/MetJ family transcriptional regulator